MIFMKEINNTKLWYLQAMGIRPYVEKQNSIKPANSIENSEDAWNLLQQRVAACTACPLHQTRTQTVFGVGSKQAKLVLVGEAPGQQEDLKGEPFVGRAGQLLDQMLLAIGLKREDVYIANILKCRPPNNRDPKPEEQNCCTPFLLEQLQLLNPKLIVALGRISAQYLLQTTETLGRLRTKQHIYSAARIPFLVTYHPAYLLRTPTDKAKAWEDLLQIKQFLNKYSLG